jgi:hypothetical protein
MHEAEKYLKENNAKFVFIRYRGERRRLFISAHGEVCMVRKGDMNCGDTFSDWEGISKLYVPDTETEIQRKLVRKYRREASKATFTNSFIRQCLQANVKKSLLENGITTGNWIEGEFISLASIAKAAPMAFEMFESAFEQSVPHLSWLFPFRGHDGLLEVTVSESGEALGNFTMKYYEYYYHFLLINDKIFIGYDAG